MVAPGGKTVGTQKIDRDKLRAKLRRLGDEYVFYMLDDAIDVLSDAQLAEFVGQYIKLEEIAPDDSSGGGKRSLRDVVAAFDAACRRGEYYGALREMTTRAWTDFSPVGAARQRRRLLRGTSRGCSWPEKQPGDDVRVLPTIGRHRGGAEVKTRGR